MPCVFAPLRCAVRTGARASYKLFKETYYIHAWLDILGLFSLLRAKSGFR